MEEKMKENLEDLKQYYKIKQEIGKNWKSSCSKLFLINKKWYYSWKQYVNKDYFDIKEKLNPNKIKKIEKEEKKDLKWVENPSPGPISNEKLIKRINSFYNDGDENNPENFIIKEELSFKTDIKMIHENLWNFFFEKYGGKPRLCHIMKNNKDKKDTKENQNNKDYLFQLNQTEIKLLFLPIKNEIIGNNEKIKKFFSLNNIKSIYIPKEKLISDLFEKIIRTENKTLSNEKNNHYGEKINSNEMRFWVISINDFNIQNLSLLIIDHYGEQALNTVLKEKDNKMDLARLELVNKKIDKIFFSPQDIRAIYNEQKTKIEELFPDTQNSKKLIFIERHNLNYFYETKYKEGCCPTCQRRATLIYNCSCQEQWYCSKRCQNRDFKNHYESCKTHCLELDNIKKNIFSVRAICGLRNLGNTCYMNTAVQCLNSCWELTNFFLIKNFEHKINVDNPLGYKGILCKAYSNLIHHLWYGVGNVYNPTNFFLIIGNINETFSGRNQQDAQEFLNFLIDGLHEDLNLVKDKPNIMEEKIKGEKKAKIEWLNFKRRNQSVLIKLFYGQFLSNISCPNHQCQCQSTKFEPFMSVSVPLTLQSKKIIIKCFFIFYYTDIKPILIELPLNNDCTVMALRNKISKILNIHPFSFIICKLNENNKLKYFINFSQQISIISKYNNQSKNQEPYFLMQLDPDIFNNPKNNSYKDLKEFKTKGFEKLNKKIMDKASSLEPLFDNEYVENEKGAPSNENIPISFYQQNTDEESTNSKKEKNIPKFGKVIVENYGLNDNFLLVPLHLNWYNQENFKKPSFIYFPRILLLKKDMTCKEIHKLVFKIFNHAINLTLNKKVDFKDIFKDLKTDMENDYYKKNDNYYYQLRKNYLYRLRIVNINKKKINLKKSTNQNNNDLNIKSSCIIKPCVICGETDCTNCLLPYTDFKLIDYINTYYPKNKMNKTVDGTYYFLTENQRMMINYTNKDFQLEMTWLENYKDILYDKINDYEKLNFQPTVKETISSIPLKKCFEYFMNWEKLDNYTYKCELCKTEKTPFKKIQIYKFPYYLIIHLKRFIDYESKINTEVKFPLRGLNLNQYVIDKDDCIEKIYDLRCIMYHTGDLAYGHYYAICYNTIHNKWFLYNDDRVTEIKESDISTKDAYVLFYRRRGLEQMIDLEKIYLQEFKDYSSKIENLKRAKANKRDNNE